MSEELTIERAEARITELAQSLIGQLREQVRKFTTVIADGNEIKVYEGETFCGPILNEDGSVHHWTILLPTPEKPMNWADAGKSAKERGGERPSSSEAWLILANANAKAKIKTWFWLDKEQGSDYAWYCSSDGGQDSLYRSAACGGVAVRRVFP